MYTILPKFGFAQKLNPNGYSDYVCMVAEWVRALLYSLREQGVRVRILEEPKISFFKLIFLNSSKVDRLD